MSSRLKQTIRALRTDLFSDRFQKEFTSARRRHRVLAAHNTIASVLGVLNDEHTKTYPERESLSRVLITEQQRSPSPFWSAALLTAYYPMLSRLRHRIYGDTLPDADLDQLVVSTFLFVVDEIPLKEKTDRIAMWLRQQTQRQVFRILRSQQRHQRLIDLTAIDEVDLGDDPAWPEMSENAHYGPTNAKDAAEAVNALLEHAGEVIDAECFDLMTATLICGRRISNYVNRMLPDMKEDERQRFYQKIKRRHSRALARLRPELDHLRCPQPNGDALCHVGQSNEPKELFE